MQAPYLQYILRRGGLDVSVVACPGRDDAYYLFDGEPKSAMAGGLKAEEEYADDWRGVALCEVGDPRRPVWAAIKSAHDFTSGPFHFFGDAELLGRVRKALGIAQGAPPGA